MVEICLAQECRNEGGQSDDWECLRVILICEVSMMKRI